eukprot:UN06397
MKILSLASTKGNKINILLAYNGIHIIYHMQVKVQN